MSSLSEMLSGFEPPQLPTEFAESLISDAWGLTATAKPLVGERTANIRLCTPAGDEFVMQLQRATGGLPDSVFDMQTRALAHAHGRAPQHLPHGVRLAEVIETDGRPWIEVDAPGGDGGSALPVLARLVTYLDGVTFVDAGELEPAAYLTIGEVVGGLAASLVDFEHPHAAHPMPWDIANGLICDNSMWALLEPATQVRLERFRPRLDAALDLMQRLPRQTIHNDVHIDNLVRATTRSSAPTGVIDFGDCVNTVRVADVAIAAESFAPLHHDPIAVTAELAAGYRRRAPLTSEELDAVGELVLARFSLTVLLMAHHIHTVPRLAGRSAQAMDTGVDRLVRWAELDPDEITTAIHQRIEADEEHRS